MYGRGEHGTTVVYADRFIPEDEKQRAAETGEEPQTIPFLKRFTVFNLAQCEGLPDEIAVATPPPDARAHRAEGRGADQGYRDRLSASAAAALSIFRRRTTCRCRRRKRISSRSIGTGPHSMSLVTRRVIRHG